MNCEQARNLFDAYLDGELSSALETELHAHRLNCPDCRQELALMEVAGHVIQSGTDEFTLQPDFTDRLLACVAADAPQRRSRRGLIIRIGAGLAAAACVTLVLVRMIGPTPQVAPFAETGPDTAVSDAAVGSDPEGEFEMPAPGFQDAATALQRSLEDAMLETHESSASLWRLGEMTLLQLIDTLQTDRQVDVDSAEAAPGEASPAQDVAGEDADDADDVEDI
ncbi:MAG: zf-HC2 domain-containing protein [Planctomycetes bacterium]|nr:zf-HC2 domain-containing protein [Planctomycetota bacterium]